MWGFWLIASGIFFILEIFTSGFLIFWLGIAGLLAMITSFITTSVGIQILVFVIASCLLIVCTKPLVNKFLKVDKSDTIPTNVYRMIGKEGIVIEDIKNMEYTGKVKISGELWSAISDEDIEKGTKIKVLEVEGVKLKVEPINKTAKIG